MQCIIISIYQLVSFSEGKVHSLLRFRWRINRSVLDCITDTATSSRRLHTVWGWLRPSALNPAKRDSLIPVLFTEGGNPARFLQPYVRLTSYSTSCFYTTAQ